MFCWNAAMKSWSVLLVGLWCLTTSVAQSQIQPEELVAPKMEISGADLNFTVQPSLPGRNYQLQYSDTMAGGTWQDLGVVRSGDGTNLAIATPYVAGVTRRFYRIALVEAPAAPAGFSLIPAGSFQMGDQSSPLVGYSSELPVRAVQVSAFYMEKNLVTMEMWNVVRAWGLTHGYGDVPGAAKGVNHPVQTITWFQAVAWCNARSEKDGLAPCYTVFDEIYRGGSPMSPVCNWSANGYRLPTEAEWEKAARGGRIAESFPWGNTISNANANFNNIGGESYQTGSTGYNPIWGTGSTPYTSPAGSFAANGYGLYDMAGNVWQWCWDWYAPYSAGSQTDPRGPASALGSHRVNRGGGWSSYARFCRVAMRLGETPSMWYSNVGFRVVRSSAP